MTLSGLAPATFRFVANRLSVYVTACPPDKDLNTKIRVYQYRIKIMFSRTICAVLDGTFLIFPTVP
jgi:hypothetical protein